MYFITKPSSHLFISIIILKDKLPVCPCIHTDHPFQSTSNKDKSNNLWHINHCIVCVIGSFVSFKWMTVTDQRLNCEILVLSFDGLSSLVTDWLYASKQCTQEVKCLFLYTYIVNVTFKMNRNLQKFLKELLEKIIWIPLLVPLAFCQNTNFV